MNLITDILAQIEQSTDPVATIRQLVLTHGGHWCDLENVPVLFEIQLMGLVGIGPSASAAVDAWIIQAKSAVSKDVEAR